mgnify:CR=1 FL=1
MWRRSRAGLDLAFGRFVLDCMLYTLKSKSYFAYNGKEQHDLGSGIAEIGVMQ